MLCLELCVVKRTLFCDLLSGEQCRVCVFSDEKLCCNTCVVRQALCHDLCIHLNTVLSCEHCVMMCVLSDEHCANDLTVCHQAVVG